MKNNVIIKFAVILVFILGTKNCFAQSKSETENWLISIIEDPGYRFNSYHSYFISFENDNMIIVSPFLKKTFEYRIPLKSLGKIKLQKLDDGYRLLINCSNEACMKYGEYINGDINNYQFISYKKQTIITFGPSLEYDSLPSRLLKALKYLVQLNGGKLIEEPF